MSLPELRALAARVLTAMEKVRARERAEVIERMTALAASVGMTPKELLLGRGMAVRVANGRRKAADVPAAPKFRDPATGATWTGRGRRPGWIKKGDPEKFRVAA